MRKARTRIWSVLLAFAMVLTMLPATALAGEGVAFAEMTIDGTTVQYNNQQTFLFALQAAEGKTIAVKLLSDVEVAGYIPIDVSQRVVFDLNGFTLSTTVQPNDSSRHYYAINNYGVLTLMDTVGTGAIIARGVQNLGGGTMIIESGKIISCDANGGASVWNEGNLVINDGIFETKYVGTSGDNVGIGCLNNSGTARITGGTFNDVNRRTYAIISTGEIEITPAAGKSVKVHGAHGGLAVDSGVAVVNGGEYSSDDFYGLYVSNDGMGLDPEQAVVTVNGGTFSGKAYAVWIGSDYNNPVNSTIEINGGVFKNPLNAQECTREGAIVVKGGTFSGDVSEFVSKSCEEVQNPDGTITVVQMTETNAAAKVTGSSGTAYYKTLADAVAEAKNGDTVTLLANAELAATLQINGGKTITIDLNGFDISYSSGVVLVQDAHVTFTGRGTIWETAPYLGAITLKGSDDPSDMNYTSVTVGEDVTLIAWAPVFITPYQSSGAPYAYGVTVDLYGTLQSAEDTYGDKGHGVYVNGQIKHTTNYPVINLYPTCTVTSEGDGIYAAGYAEWNINGASVTGYGMGIGIKAGTLNISGDAEIRCTGPNEAPTEGFSNGINASGAAIQIESNVGYAGEIKINIADGNIISDNGYAIYEYANNQDPLQVSSVAISGGNIRGALTNCICISETMAEDGVLGVSGGTFSSPVREYVVDSLNYELNSRGVYSYYATLAAAVSAAQAGDTIINVNVGAAEPAEVCTVNFADAAVAPINVLKGDKLDLPVPQRQGCQFIGWYLNGKLVESPYTVMENVTLTANWLYISGGDIGSAPSYNVNVTSAANGKITVNPVTAAAGIKVAITVTPDEGYELANLTVTDASGFSISVTEQGGKYIFTMPSSAVTVAASFQAKGTAPTEPTVPAGWVNPYSDVAAADWYYDAVGYVSANGLMSGTSATTFAPAADMSRAMVWTVLARMAGQNVNGADPWYQDALAWAVAAGVSDGTNAEGSITREELVTMLYRMAGSPEVTVSDLGLIGQYPDGDNVSGWAQDALAWALSKGVINGRDGKLAAGGDITRAEAATVLARYHLMSE